MSSRDYSDRTVQCVTLAKSSRSQVYIPRILLDRLIRQTYFVKIDPLPREIKDAGINLFHA